ncbi:MAG: protein-L-isoaspartate O-methyltransferase [Halothiobacillaceae bacterium]|nr:protein-L-isoaspartate O-methyltransferase [Halothiobacillaceae bacterium]
MMAFDTELARFNMVEQQVRPWDVLDQRVLDVFRLTPREKFVPQALRLHAFTDTLLPLGHGEVMMPPVVEGRLLQSLDIQKHEHVLEIGTGSGFLTACLARLGASVLSVDIHADFTHAADERLSALDIDNVRLETGDALGGWQPNPDHGFDVIVVTGALLTIPDTLRSHLKIGGRLFVITSRAPAMAACVLTRVDETAWSERQVFETCLPYLVGAEPAPRFVF